MLPGERIAKNCLKFLSRNCRYCRASLTASAWLVHGLSYRRPYGALRHIRHTVQFNVPCVTAQCNVYFFRSWAWISTEYFHYGNLHKAEIYETWRRKLRVRFSQCFISFEISMWSMSESWRRSSLICSKLYTTCGNVGPSSLLCVLIGISITSLYLAIWIQLFCLISMLLSVTLLHPNFLCHILHSGLLAKRSAFVMSLQVCYVSHLSPFFDWTCLIIHLLVPKIINQRFT